MVSLGARHSPSIEAILRAVFARQHDPRPTRDEVVATLEGADYAAHEPALAFDEAYGGLGFVAERNKFDQTPVDAGWSFDDSYAWMIGARACVASGAHSHPRGGERFRALYGDGLDLVPVAYGPQDDMYMIDGIGRGYYWDTCYDVGGPHLVAHDPTQLFARIVLQCWCLSAAPFSTRRRVGGQAESIASQANLAPLPEACGPHERWWGDGVSVVGEVPDLPFPGAGSVRYVTFLGSDDAQHVARVP